ncbi:MAG: O-antigen ligase family protein [Acidobacteria bacterium]|nr:O-antigen ligase family protein [Acidobacteriota bacterium]MCI0719225.1 O-antigen ligase family protein [Acidobacteriota bacterium]
MFSSPMMPSSVAISLETEGTKSGVELLWFSVARWLFGATILVAPLTFGAVQIWAWGLLTLSTVLILLLWAVGTAQWGILRLTWSPLYLPALAFLLLGAAQYFGHLTLDPVATRESLIKLLTNVIIFFLAAQLWAVGSEKALLRFGMMVLVFAFLLGLVAILQFFTGHNQIYWIVESPGYTFGPYVNHNHYAGLIEMLIPIALAYLLSHRRIHSARTLLAFGILIPIASLLLSGSRGGAISLLVEILILAFVLARYTDKYTRRNLVTLAALAVTAVALLFFWLAPDDISKRLASIANWGQYSEATFRDRTQIAQDCVRILRDYPWSGIGLGSFENAYPRYQSSPSDLVTDHAHNDYLEILVETGCGGGLLIASALLVFLRLAFKNLRQRLKHQAGWIRLGAALGCSGLLVHSLFDFNLHIPANAAWFVVCAAFATHQKPLSTELTGRRSLESAVLSGHTKL